MVIRKYEGGLWLSLSMGMFGGGVWGCVVVILTCVEAGAGEIQSSGGSYNFRKFQ